VQCPGQVGVHGDEPPADVHMRISPKWAPPLCSGRGCARGQRPLRPLQPVHRPDVLGAVIEPHSGSSCGPGPPRADRCGRPLVWLRCGLTACPGRLLARILPRDLQPLSESTSITGWQSRLGNVGICAGRVLSNTATVAAVMGWPDLVKMRSLPAASLRTQLLEARSGGWEHLQVKFELGRRKLRASIIS
jgi:hypothetical protein